MLNQVQHHKMIKNVIKQTFKYAHLDREKGTTFININVVKNIYVSILF